MFWEDRTPATINPLLNVDLGGEWTDLVCFAIEGRFDYL
jgi:hypothetical protein